MHCDFHIIQRCQIFKQTDILEGSRQPHTRYRIRLHTADFLHRAIDIQLDFPLTRFINTGKQVEQRRLSGTVWTNQSNQLLFIDFHIYIGHRTKTTKVLCQSADLQQCHINAPPSFSRTASADPRR